MWPDQRSSTIRNLIPGAIIFIYLWYFGIFSIISDQVIDEQISDQVIDEQISDQVIDEQTEDEIDNIFLIMVAIISIVFGFVLDIIIIPLLISLIKKFCPSFELQYSRVAIQNLIDYELADVEEVAVRKGISSALNSTSIFDAFMNEFEEDKVIDRLFFLFDLIHALRMVIFIAVIAIITAIVKYSDFPHARSILTILGLCIFAISCIKIYRRKFDQANNYEFSLTLKNFAEIWKYIKRIKCQRMLDILIAESAKQNIDPGTMCTEQRKLIQEAYFGEAFKKAYSYYEEYLSRGDDPYVH
jgi:hypothetical protein